MLAQAFPHPVIVASVMQDGVLFYLNKC